MQRLFTTFPNSWPGGGLLLLRLVLAVGLLVDRPSLPAGSTSAVVLNLSEMAIAPLLAIGLWTPVLCLVQFAVEVLLMARDHEWSSARHLFAPVYLSLAMLGPGAWSIDARLFGRRRLDVEAD
jgi:putative oxidoreductase